MKKMSAALGIILAGTLASTASQACRFIGRGNASDDTDCAALIKSIYINEAQAPDYTKLSHAIIRNFSAGSSGMSPNGFLVTYNRYMDSLCLVRGGDETPLLNLLFQDAETANFCWYNRGTRLPGYYYSKEKDHGGNAYAVKQWGNFFISMYGPEAEITNPAASENFLISKIGDGPMSAVTSGADALQRAKDTALNLEIRVYNVALFFQLTPNPGDGVLPGIDLLKDETNPVKMRKQVIDGLAEYNDPRANQALVAVLNDTATDLTLAENILHSYRGRDQDFKYAVARALSGANADRAIQVAGNLKIWEAVLPLLDLVSVSTGKDRLISAVWALGQIASPRALPKLKQPEFYGNSDQDIRVEVRNSVALIDGAMNVAAIKKGDSGAIAWGKEIIMMNDGSKKELIFQILAAFRVAKTLSPDLRAEIKKFVRAEIESGYHNYDPEMLAELKKTLL